MITIYAVHSILIVLFMLINKFQKEKYKNVVLTYSEVFADLPPESLFIEQMSNQLH